MALAAVLAATAVLIPFRAQLSPVQIMLLYVPVIVAVARATGVRPSALAAVASFAAVDLLFVPPYYVFTVDSPADWLTLVVFLAVALVAGVQAGRVRESEKGAVRQQEETALLFRLSSRLVTRDSTQGTASLIVSEIVSVAGASRSALYGRGEEGRPRLIAEAGAPAASPADESALVEWVLRNDKAVALPSLSEVPADLRPAVVPADEAAPGIVADGAFVPLQSPMSLEGVLYARAADGSGFPPSGVRQLLAVANLAAAFLERQRLEGEASHTAALRESDRLKSTLVSSVSHELKTPLAAVTARVTGLIEEGEGCDAARVRSELGMVAEDLGRLESSIRDLLDLSRLESDSWRPRPEAYGIGEILGTVMSRLPAGQQQRVRFDVPDELPEIRVDFSQWARALSNLVENALAYGPADGPVTVGARVLGHEAIVWVEDGGPGVPDDEKDEVFEKFFRGSAASAVPGGTGLGLAITREIVRTHGGRVWVEDAEPRGARFIVALPLGEEVE